MKRVIAAATMALVLAACTSAEEGGSDSPPQLPRLDTDIEKPQLALADHMLESYFASDIPMRPTVCIATTYGREEIALEQGWERELMMRYPSLAPFSRCALLKGEWQDARTGVPALVFSLHSFTCVTAASCSGIGEYKFGQTSSLASRYQLEWGGKRWLFTREDQVLDPE